MQLKPKLDFSTMTTDEVMAFFSEFPSTKNLGVNIVSYSDNFDHILMQIPFNEQTINFMGITFGGVMYAATDGMYAMMLWYRLGIDYIAIDKHSVVENIRPGMSDLHVAFHLSDEEVTLIKSTLESKKSITRKYKIDIFDKKQKLVCRITKTLYIRKRPQR